MNPWIDPDMRRIGLAYRWVPVTPTDGSGSNLPGGATGIAIRVETAGYVSFIDDSGDTVRMFIPQYADLSTSVRRVLSTNTTASNIFVALVG